MAHHQWIRDLVAEIRSLREQLEATEYYEGESSYRHQQELARAESKAREAQRQADETRYNLEQVEYYDRQIERARRYGNDYEAERLERSKRLYY